MENYELHGSSSLKKIQKRSIDTKSKLVAAQNREREQDKLQVSVWTLEGSGNAVALDGGTSCPNLQLHLS